MIKCLSLDLQGTLSDASFSDYFWIELLPIKYAEKNNLTLEQAKSTLKQKFKSWGVYSMFYYDNAYWTKELGFDAISELTKFGKTPKLNEKFMNFIQSLDIQKIIISTTSDLFIDYELGEKKSLFQKAFSCVDYFHTAGKTPQIYLSVAQELQLKPQEILHVGDSLTMDIENAKFVGVKAIHFQGDTDKTIAEIKSYLPYAY